MATLERTQILPFRLTDDGTIRIGDSRVSLESVIYHYKLGASPEEISQKFPAVDLADVYASITYYLNNQATVEEYLRQQETNGGAVEERINSDPQNQKQLAELRSRILVRQSKNKTY